MRLGVSSSPITTKCLFRVHISHPRIKCTFAEMVTVEWDSIVRVYSEAEHIGAVCKHTVGHLDGFTVSASAPLGLQSFTSHLGVVGRGCLPLTGCCSPSNQFTTNEGCSWEQRGASGSLQVARLSADTTEVQEMATSASVHFTFAHCKPRDG